MDEMDEPVGLAVLSPTEDKDLSIDGMESVPTVTEVHMKNIEKLYF
jgi:hypothetical protein